MNKERYRLYAAVYLILIKNNKILLLKRFNTGWQDGKYSLVAGHLDGNETVVQAMVREIKEEAGITVKPNDLKVVHTMHRISNDREYIDFFLTTDNWRGEPKVGEPNKCDEVGWFPLENLPVNTLPFVGEVIKRWRRGLMFSEWKN